MLGRLQTCWTAPCSVAECPLSLRTHCSPRTAVHRIHFDNHTTYNMLSVALCSVEWPRSCAESTFKVRALPAASVQALIAFAGHCFCTARTGLRQSAATLLRHSSSVFFDHTITVCHDLMWCVGLRSSCQTPWCCLSGRRGFVVFLLRVSQCNSMHCCVGCSSIRGLSVDHPWIIRLHLHQCIDTICNCCARYWCVVSLLHTWGKYYLLAACIGKKQGVLF